MKRIFAVVFLCLMAFTICAPTQAIANPRGELVAKDSSNLPTGGKCGIYGVNFYNASDTAILGARLLVYVWTGGDVDTPYRKTKKRSWVSFKMYLKPGQSAKGEAKLCSTAYLAPNAVDFASFKVRKVTWTWAD